MDMETLLELDTLAQIITVTKSMFLHPVAGLGLFPFRPVTVGELVGYYYGSLAFSDPTKKR